LGADAAVAGYDFALREWRGEEHVVRYSSTVAARGVGLAVAGVESGEGGFGVGHGGCDLREERMMCLMRG
jgi:hypothetical protein